MERKRKAKISLSKPKKKKLNETEPKNEDIKIEPLISNEKAVIAAPDGTESLDTNDKYPILKDEELVKKFMAITMTNNQKGRIRQTVKAYVTGSSDDVIPQVLHDKMQEILDTQQPLNESSLRKMRILYNMLKTVLDKKTDDNTVKDKKKKKNKKAKKNKEANESSDVNIDTTQTNDTGNNTTDTGNNTTDTGNNTNDTSQTTEEKVDAKIKGDGKENAKSKGPKRYVVFVGNLPVNISEDKLRKHFANVSKHIQDIRIPVRAENKKSCIAYVELKNESAYELALSKHHSMLGNKRLNVLYTAQKNGKISKTEAKSKAAKLVALQKAGKLLGSIPLNKKRSHRRALLKAARAKENKT